jgi:hemoglobin
MAVAVAVSAALYGCAGMQMQQPDASLYERLGGKPAITAVVDDFVGNVAADSRINGFFARTDIPRLKTQLVAQICAGSGGPCNYTGRDMKSAHAGMGVSEAHFNALVEDLVKTLDKFKVPDREKNELLALLGPMKADIVNR